VSRLRINASRAYLPAGEPHVTMLYPFWGRADVDVPRPDFADRYVEHGSEHLELTDLYEAELAVFPQNWKRGLVATPETLHQRAEAFAAEARAAGKPYVLFSIADASDPVPVPGALQLRASLVRSRRTPLEHALPGFHEDLTEYTGGELVVREYRPRAVVGFCGVALSPDPDAGAVQRMRRRLSRPRQALFERFGRPLPEDVWVRSRALAALAAQDAVATNLVVRTEGGGGGFFPFDPERWRMARREFVDNIVESDYVLCARGHGNFSYRLWETLSLGRIPVFVDTDCVLPYDFLVDWRDYCVWIDRTEIPRIGEKVAAFHERLSPADFVERQHACRRLWEEYLTPEGFFANFHRIVERTR
jgi:hypothetical protein